MKVGSRKKRSVKRKSKSKSCRQKDIKKRMACVRSFKKKSRSRRGKGFGGGEMLTYDDLRDLV